MPLIYALTADFSPEVLDRIDKSRFSGHFSEIDPSDIEEIIYKLEE
jgi:hypothetical protein